MSNFNNEKGNLVRAFCCRYKLDGIWGQESGINWDLVPYSTKVDSMFKMENALYSVAAHNVHSKVARQQYGSTFAMAFGELATKAMESDVDPTGLGCWAWIQFSGCDGLKMRVLSVYQPNHTSREDSKRVYAQHRQYFHRIHHHECPRKILIDDLRTLILKWKGDDIRVIIFMDANENMKNGHMQHMLTEEDIGLRPVTTSQHPDLPLTTTHK